MGSSQIEIDGDMHLDIPVKDAVGVKVVHS